MTYVVKVWNRKDQARMLKGFDKDKPVYIYPSEWRKGKAIQEFANSSTALIAIEKIKKVERWVHYDIVRLI